MVVRSDRDYKKHCEQVYMYARDKYGDKRADKFIKVYRSRYDKFNRSFIDYKLALVLMDDLSYLSNKGTKWYAFVGVGGTGKSTIAKNVSYFIDPTFDLSRITTDMRVLIKKMAELPTLESKKAVFMDEPDDEIHINSIEGKKIRRIFGKARQQHILISIASTDLTDIPTYIFRKLDGIFFTPFLGRGMYFKNKPKQKSYVLQKIRSEYSKKGYSVFFELQKDVGCMNFNTHKLTPLFNEESEYLKQKRKDYEKDINDFINEKGKKKLSERDKIILNMKNNGLSDREIGNNVGLSRMRVNQIINKHRKMKGDKHNK